MAEDFAGHGGSYEIRPSGDVVLIERGGQPADADLVLTEPAPAPTPIIEETPADQADDHAE